MPGIGVPKIFFWAVVMGMKMVSSWSWPEGDWPFVSRTPSTVKGTFLILIVWPTGSWSPKRLSTTVRPRSATLVAPLTSCCVNGLPEERFQSRPLSMLGVVPVTPVDQFWWPYTTCATPLNTGATSEIAELSFWIASASANVSVDCVPEPIRTPPAVVAPGSTIRILPPMLEMNSEILLLAPAPTATIAITAPTPMMIPSMVRAERILFTQSARRDILKIEGILIMIVENNQITNPKLQIITNDQISITKRFEN